MLTRFSETTLTNKTKYIDLSILAQYLQMETNKLGGNSTKYAKVYFTHSCNHSNNPIKLVFHLVITFGGDFLFFFFLRIITLVLGAVHN